MARKPSPWYWPERNGWYTILNGSRHPLGEHPADLPPPVKRKGRWVVPPAIDTTFHALLAAPPSAPEPTAASTGTGITVSAVLDKFLDWTQRNRAARTYEWYRDHLQAFLDHLGTDLPAADLRPFHVVGWADAHSGWSYTYRRGAIVAVQRAFNWAEELGHVAASPVKRIRKPAPKRRESYVTPDGFAELVANYAEGDPFRDLLAFCWHSGCRPQEAIGLEARHVRLADECAVIPAAEAKGRRRPRVILLHGPALEIVRRLLPGRPIGKLFLNADGRPWTRFAVANRFDRRKYPPGELEAAQAAHRQALRDRRKRLLKLAREHGSKVAAYDLRHSFCQRLLEGGANHLAVAELMGHTSGRMVAETYSHMNRATGHLKETLRKAAGGAGA